MPFSFSRRGLVQDEPWYNCTDGWMDDAPCLPDEVMLLWKTFVSGENNDTACTYREIRPLVLIQILMFFRFLLLLNVGLRAGLQCSTKAKGESKVN